MANYPNVDYSNVTLAVSAQQNLKTSSRPLLLSWGLQEVFLCPLGCHIQLNRLNSRCLAIIGMPDIMLLQSYYTIPSKSESMVHVVHLKSKSYSPIWNLLDLFNRSRIRSCTMLYLFQWCSSRNCIVLIYLYSNACEKTDWL